VPASSIVPGISRDQNPQLLASGWFGVLELNWLGVRDSNGIKRRPEEFCANWPTPQTTDLMGFRQWLAALDDFRNWLTWACGPRNAMKISASE
jgi:hypothetical protein